MKCLRGRGLWGRVGKWKSEVKSGVGCGLCGQSLEVED